MKNVFLIILSIFYLAGCANSQTQKAVVENVDAAKFKALVDSGKGIILDVRAPEELAEGGYIAKAVNYNYYEDDFESQVTKLDKNKEIYVYCAGGGRSLDAAKFLVKNGFLKVYNLEDGFDDWKKKGLPVVKE